MVKDNKKDIPLKPIISPLDNLLFPDPSLIDYGLNLINNEDYDGALGFYDEVIEKVPLKSYFLMEKASVLFKMKKTKDGFKACDDAIAAETKQKPKLIVLKGIYQEQLNDDKNALKSYSEAITRKPFYYFGYMRRAMLYYKKKNYDKAIDDFNKIIELLVSPEYT